jgi:quercetin dioxygenase-like cupin family protein
MGCTRYAYSRRVSLTCLMLLPAFLATAADPVPEPIRPADLEWSSPPGLPGLASAWIIGSQAAAGTYVLRVRLGRGARIPPHTHPDERHTVVLSGTLYVGFGEVFDPARLVAMPRGTVYVAPANVPHFLWARDGEVEYQEAGVGPTGTVWAGQPADPR